MSHIPYVIEHILHPTLDQPPIRKTYSYSTRNFLGRDAPDVVWSSGEDALSKVLNDYRYSSDEFWMVGEGQAAEIRKIVTREYNRFHLLVSETTRCDGTLTTQRTEYHDIPGVPFSEQPGQCLLPRAVTTRLSRSAADAASPSVRGEQPEQKVREETVCTEFDAFGNLLMQTSAAGVIEQYSYYAADGEDGCPPDPQQFVRWIKERRVIPGEMAYEAADGTLPKADGTIICYRYTMLPALGNGHGGSQPTHYTVPSEECFYEAGCDPTHPRQLRRTSTYGYIDRISDAALHGRLLTETVTFNTCSTQMTHAYTIDANTLRTTTTTTGFDGCIASRTETRSRAHGQLLEVQDEDGVCIRYAYDAMGRVTSETTAPDTAYAASRDFAYWLSTKTDDPVGHEVRDAHGMITRTWTDGLNRPCRVEKGVQTALPNASDAGPLHLVYQAQFDAMGQLVKETETDWLDEQPLGLDTTYEYDAWGRRFRQTSPDGVSEYCQYDPISRTEMIWLQAPDDQVANRVRQQLNAFDKIDAVHRYDANDAIISLQRQQYDGLGRCVASIDVLGHTTRREYDVFDRVVCATRPDGVKQTFNYAPHSDKDLPIQTALQAPADATDTPRRIAGEQTFDGLDRCTKRVVGGRTQHFLYEASTLRPCAALDPSGVRIDYDYTPALSERPTRRTAPTSDVHYSFDRHAQLIEAVADDTAANEYALRWVFDYDAAGHPTQESWHEEGVALQAMYEWSLLGRALRYTDRFGHTQHTAYDAAGRPSETQYRSMRSTITYDGLGRPFQRHSVSDADSGANADGGAAFSIDYRYDVHGREVARHFALSSQAANESLQLTHTFNALDQLVQRTFCSGELILRDETLEYDVMGQLSRYCCKGSTCALDQYGHAIRAQTYDYDIWQNVVRIISTFDDTQNASMDEAWHLYENPADPTQLTRITHSHPSYPAQIDLIYDANGNIRQTQDCTFQFDALNRLEQIDSEQGVSPSCAYRYDALDRLMAVSDNVDGETAGRQSSPSGSTHWRYRRYHEGRLASETSRTIARRYVAAGNHAVGHFTRFPENDATEIQLYGTDQGQRAPRSVAYRYATDYVHALWLFRRHPCAERHAWLRRPT